MKRITALALAACLLLGLTLTGCGSETSTPPTNPPATGTPATTAPDPTEAPVEPTDPPATPEPTVETASPEEPTVPPLLDNGLELPVDGATGFSSVNLPVWPDCPDGKEGYKLEDFNMPDQDDDDWPGGSYTALYSGAMAVLIPGTGFQIIEEVGDWWHINYIDQASLYGERLTTGWIEHRYCFINLPDVIPSILYTDTNCSGSILVSCGKEIPNVTGKSFYNTFEYNVRLAHNEYIMPILYSAARDVCAVQHKALADGNCLEIYQTFRPLQTQKAISNALSEIAKVDPEIEAGISTAPWTAELIMPNSTSDYQLGYALDVTIVKISAAEIKKIDEYSYFKCTEFEPYEMPTPIHEMSFRAASQMSPDDTTLSEGLQNNEYAQLLREYFTTSGFTPSPAQWWHFNNIAAQSATSTHPSKGDYYTEILFSSLPSSVADQKTVAASAPAPTGAPETAEPDPTSAPATAEPTPEPIKEPVPVTQDPNGLGYNTNNRLDIEIPPLLSNGFELPVDGATGFASVNLPVWPANPGDRPGYKLASASTPAPFSDTATAHTQSVSFQGAMAVLAPGTGFQIIEEVGDWWHINYSDPNSMFGDTLTAGWVEHRYCFINLPDVIPSILYNDTNCSGSIFVSCGKDIPGVTGKSFYSTYAYNVRLGRSEFIMPMLYTAAKDVCAVQHKALADGNCLEIYQTFRPLHTQKSVAGALSDMAKVDPEVKAVISTAPWSFSSFIDTGAAGHQMGYALDATLVQVRTAEIKQVASYPYLSCTDYERYTMPTSMHELSMAAISQVSPGNTTLAPTMTDAAVALRTYFTDAGFVPSPSEWWHFEHTNAQKATEACPSKGDYFTEQSYSTLPN